MQSTTFHCNGCITPLFKNGILYHDVRENILIIKEENALGIKKINDNIIQCETCKINLGIYENTYKTFLINKNLVVSITIVTEIEEN